MKKSKSTKRSSAKKNNSSPNHVEKYLANIPEPAYGTLTQIRAVIRSTVPAEATEAISYGIPAFKYKGTLVGYGAFRDHCSLFPMSAALIVEFKEELKSFQTSKGTIQFPVDKPLSTTLLKKLVKARVAQNERKSQR
jgi:uncharacterized protein YdhG (YjbR/CyaY superfamily)